MDYAKPKTECCPMAEVRFRAGVLADSGKFAHWEEIGAQIEAENCPGAVNRIAAEATLRTQLNARCRLARGQTD